MHLRLFVCTLLIVASFSSLARAEWGFELENSGIHLDYGHNPVPAKGTVLFPATAHPTTLDQLFTGTPWPWKEDWVLTVDEQVGTNNRDLEFVSRALPLKAGLLNNKRVCNAFKTLRTKAFGPLNAARTSPPAGTFTVTLHQDSSHSSTFNLKAVSNKDSWSPQITLSLPMGTAAPGSHSALWQFLKGLVTTNILESSFIFGGNNDIFTHMKNIVNAIDKATFHISDAEKAFVAVIASYWYSGACIQNARPTYFRLFPGYPKGVASFILMRTSLAAIYHHLGPKKKTPQQLAQIVIDLGQLIRDTTSNPAAQGVAGGCVKNQCDVAADPSTAHGINHDAASVFFSVCSHNAGIWAVKPEANFAPTLNEFFTALGNGHDVLSNHGYDAVHHPAHPTDVFESMGKIQALDGSHQDMVRFELRFIVAGVGFNSKDDATAQSTLLSRIWSVYKAGQTALKGKPVTFAKTMVPAKCFQ